MPQSIPYTLIEIYNNVQYESDGQIVPVLGVSRPSAAELFAGIDAATMTVISQPKAAEIFRPLLEATIVSGTSVISAVEFGSYVDVSQSQGTSVPLSSEQMAFIDSATSTAVSVIPPAGEATNADGGVVTGISVLSSTDTQSAIDSGPMTTVNQSSAVDIAGLIDAATVTSISNIKTVDVINGFDANTLTGVSVFLANEVIPTGTNYTDIGTTTAISVVSSTDGKTWADATTVTAVSVPSGINLYIMSDIGVVTGFSAPSGTDIHTTSDVGTGTGVSVPSSVDTIFAVDSATETAVSAPSALDANPKAYIDSATATSVTGTSISAAETYTGYMAADFFDKAAVTNGWGVPDTRGVTWTISSGTTSWYKTSGTQASIGPINSNTGAFITQNITNATWGDVTNVEQIVSFSWNLIPNAGTMNIGGLVGYFTDNNNCYRIRISQASTGALGLIVDKQVAGVNTILFPFVQIFTGAQAPTNTLFKLRGRITGINTGTVNLKARMWNSNSTEPSTWMADLNDTSGFPATGTLWGFRADKLSGDTTNPTITVASYQAFAPGLF